MCFFRLGDLYGALDKDRPRVHFSEPGPMVLGRGGQRGDIYQLVSFVRVFFFLMFRHHWTLSCCHISNSLRSSLVCCVALKYTDIIKNIIYSLKLNIA